MSDGGDPVPSTTSQPADDAVPSTFADSAPVLRSEVLLQGKREILIVHCQEVYRLRLTRNGKLILTK